MEENIISNFICITFYDFAQIWRTTVLGKINKK